MWFQKKNKENSDGLSSMKDAIKILENKLEKRLDITQSQIDCGVIYEHQPRQFIGTQSKWFCTCIYYVFECQNCALKIRKTADCLTAVERRALINLGYDNLRKQQPKKEK